MPERLQQASEHPARRSVRGPRRSSRSGLALATVASLLLALLCGFAPTTASAAPQDPQQQRDDIRRQQAAVAAQLDELTATDQELEQGVATLEANLRAQQAKLADARRAVDDAQHHIDEITARMADQEQEVAALETVVRRQAIERYINPDTNLASADLLLQSKDSGQGTMRQALANSVTANDHDALDRYRRLRAELDAEKREVSQAADDASRAAGEAEAQTHEVERAIVDHDRVKQALTARIAEFQAEAAGLNAEDAELTEVIRRAQAEEQAREAARLEAERIAALPTTTAAPVTTVAPATTTTATAPPPSSVVVPGSSSSTTTTRPSTTTTVPSSGGTHVAWPVSGTVTSEFGARWGTNHPGIDISAPIGTPVSAAKGGTVIVAGWNNGGYGNLVVIDHGNGFSTAYAHMSAITTSVGAKVSQGQGIGAVGSTGHSTGPHLHFECRVNGVAQNPRTFL